MPNCKALAVLVLLSLSLPSTGMAAQYESVARSLEAMGLIVLPENREVITAQFAAPVEADRQEWHDQSIGILEDMAALGESAERLSARLRLQDLHRQLIEILVPGDNRARDLLEARSPMVHVVEPGVGMTEDDLGWAIMLQGLHAEMPDDPMAGNISSAQAETYLEVANTKFETSGAGARHFLARIDSWGIGTVAAWDELTPEERKIATAVVVEESIPPAALLEKVIGTPNVLYWAAGVEIGLTEAEKAAYPELADYLAKGHLAGGMLEFIAGAEAGAMAANFIDLQTYMMLWDLNMGIILD